MEPWGRRCAINDAYGLLWWLNRPGTVVYPMVATTGDTGETTADQQIVPGAPEDVFSALGFKAGPSRLPCPNQRGARLVRRPS